MHVSALNCPWVRTCMPSLHILSPSIAPATAGGIQIRRVKQGGSMLRLRGGTASRASLSYYWRLALDTGAWRVVTDRAAADFVAVE